MIQANPYSILPYTQPAVLLVFFAPLDVATRQQQAPLTELADSIQAHFGDRLRVLRIDGASYPDVVRCFAVIQTPAFVLIRQGIELWRQEGMSDTVTLVPLIQGLLTT